ncbi:unnamed protein product [Pleuronectes platessa]|uniref:Uncharacterized protein n=1 Tax=Pleuronectes platessa TaxID=8262 RepID=A0A9N7Y9A5_PLEPL|nr:unnamed protein product [Pleuronectes platessa]
MGLAKWLYSATWNTAPSSPAAITVHGQQPVGPQSTIQTRRHSRPQSPSTAAHQDPPRSTARNQCQRDTGSATSTTISPHDTESATLESPPRPPVRDPQTAIHGAATEALDLRVIKQRDSGEGG